MKNQNKDIESQSEQVLIKKQRRFNGRTARAAIICLLAFTLICGIIYPLATTFIGQVAFPYEANGSQIIVTLKDGTQRVFGSELIGQQYENPKYMFGRVNLGAPSNLSPESPEYEALITERVKERREKLAGIGYIEEDPIPQDLLTASGSGLDPHISLEAALFQVPVIVKARTVEGVEIVTEEQVKEIIYNNLEKRDIGIFGEERVNVLLVNLSLDGLI